MAYLDGELCAIKEDGTTSFAELQAATDSRHTTGLIYFAFDLRHILIREPSRGPGELPSRAEKVEAPRISVVRRIGGILQVASLINHGQLEGVVSVKRTKPPAVS